jgi:hypothetical protein
MRVCGVRSRATEAPLDAPVRSAWGRGRIQSTLELVLLAVGPDDDRVGVGLSTALLLPAPFAAS